MADNRTIWIVAGVALVAAGGAAVWWLTRKPAGDGDGIVASYKDQIAAATTRVELEAVRGLIFPYIVPIVFPTSYLETGFEVDFLKGVINRAQYDILFAAYLAKLATIPGAYVDRYSYAAGGRGHQSVQRVVA